MLRWGTIVDTTVIAASSLASTRVRDPEMKQTRKRTNWSFWMNCASTDRHGIVSTRYFGCRRCHSLVYTTQRMNRPQRASHRIQKIRTRLMRPLPEKPARMHWATYQRLIEKAVQAEQERLQGE